MAETILNIALCMIVRDGEILLLRRTKEPYRGYLSLPGGKIHFGETPVEAALREAREETGLEFGAARVLGCATETISEDGRTVAQFTMFIVELDGAQGELTAGAEGELFWLGFAQLPGNARVIPTDADMIERYLLRRATGVCHYSVAARNGAYRLVAVSDLRNMRGDETESASTDRREDHE